MTRLFFSICLAAAVLLGSATVSAEAQCATCPPATVAYSPVLAPAPAATPVVYQSVQPRRGWYPGKYLSRLFRPFRRQQPAPVVAAPAIAAPVAAPTATFATAAYQPTYPPSYTAAYGQTTTVGFWPTVQNVGYAPAVQTVARPVTLTALDPCGCGPVCCGACSTPSCCGASGVTTAGFETYSGGCSNCAAQPAPQSYAPQNYAAPPANGGRLEPTPALGPNENVPSNRVQRPVYEEPAGEGSLLNGEGSGSRAAGESDSTSYWNPPQLFDARDRSASRPQPRQPTAKMWNAVYHQPAPQKVDRTALRPTSASIAPRQPTAQVSAAGWRAAD